MAMFDLSKMIGMTVTGIKKTDKALSFIPIKVGWKIARELDLIGPRILDDLGDIEINVDKLDSLVNEQTTYIKMDIEGAEAFAIEGAESTILRDHPRLAICVYHKVDDLWKIPEQVLKIRDDYKLYLRHYTEGVDETVMFFIPKEDKVD